MDDFPAKVAAELADMQIQRLIQTAKTVPTQVALFWKRDLPNITSQYLQATYRKLYYTRTILSRNTQIPLQHIYVAPSFIFNQELVNNITLVEITSRTRHALIKGAGGLGKSTALRHLFFEALQSKMYFPIYVNLRDLNKNEISLQEFIRSNIGIASNKVLPENVFNHILEQNAILFLDAFDELNDNITNAVIDEVNHISESHQSLRIIATTRPMTEKLNEAFLEIEICPLTKSQATTLARKLPLLPDIKDNFLAELNKRLYDEYSTFASSPLLLTLMALVYSAKRTIPEDISLYYNQALSVLVSEHDAHKPDGGHARIYNSGASPDQVEKIFSAFSAICLIKGSWSFNRSTAISHLEHASRMCGIQIDAQQFLDDIQKHACLLVLEGIEFTFLHRSFAEHFAAKHIAKLPQGTLQSELVKKYSQGWYMPNVFGQTFWIENPEVYIREVILPLLEKFKAELGINSFTDQVDESLFYETVSSSISPGIGETDEISFGISVTTLSSIHDYARKIIKPVDYYSNLSKADIAKLRKYLSENVRSPHQSIPLRELPKDIRKIANKNTFSGTKVLTLCDKLETSLKTQLRDLEQSSATLAEMLESTVS